MSQSTLFDKLYIVGEIDRVIFMNQENRFAVMRVLISETNTEFMDEVIVTGFFHDIAEGESYHFEGEITSHPRFGEQFKSSTYKKTVPKTLGSVIQYLSGDNFPGIGKKTATNIANTLGVNAIEKIADDIEVLKNVPGLSGNKHDMIHNHIVKNYESENVMLKLTDLGFGQKLAVKILSVYGSETMKVLDSNPYKLVNDIRGIGFKKADFIAQKNGLPANSEERLYSGILHSLNEYVMNEGHTFIEQDILIEQVLTLLNTHAEHFTPDDVTGASKSLVDKEAIVINKDRIYIPSLFYSEIKSAEQIITMQSLEVTHDYDDDDIASCIKNIEGEIGITYNALQKHAIHTAMNTRVSIITGGPGTGKTTLVKGIIETIHRLCDYENIEEYEDDDYPIKLIAPTGRAAKRLSDLSGLRATTIHRLIGWGRDMEDEAWAEVVSDVDADFIIIDEMSMVDTWLFYQLVRNISTTTSIIFVGDKDQLPSVGPGNVFHELIHSQAIPLTELKEVYRQGEGSGIVKLAHAINNNETLDLGTKMNNISFIDASIQHIPNYVHEIVTRAVKKGYTMRDIQVLAPIYRGNAGINNLNKVLQSILNPESDDLSELSISDVVFREGDKVLQLVNRLEDNVFNGDAGIIEEIRLREHHHVDNDRMTVDFEGQKITYERKDMIELSHAYCTSIHKAQGSEYPIVIMPIVSSYHSMLYKNIIYTGITRAKESLILCGDKQAFYQALNRYVPKRHTSFIEYLQKSQDLTEESTLLPQYLTSDNFFTIPALIGMDGITPYDFIDS